MKSFKKLIVLCLLLLGSTILYSCKEDPTTTTNEVPYFTGIDDITISLFDSINLLEGIKAYDFEDGDLTNNIVINNDNFKANVVGVYQITYSVIDSDFNESDASRTVTVNDIDGRLYPLANYPGGIDLSVLSASQHAVLFSALEKYLTENLIGGIPISQGSNMGIVYSSRVQLYLNSYNSIFGYGDIYSSLNQDDSNVYLLGDSVGSANEYTWREAYDYDLNSLNPWNEYFMRDELYQLNHNSFYTKILDNSLLGYQVVPSLAKGDPTPINGEIVNNIMTSTTWVIDIKDDLTWTFHPDINIANLPSDTEKLTAKDFYDTWKYAIDHDWAYASNYGSESILSIGIVNALEYSTGKVAWSQVGIKLLEESNQIQIEFEHAISANLVKYFFSDGMYAPQNMDLVNLYGSDYGLTPESVASSGPYYIDEQVVGSYMSFKKNDHYPLANLYHYSGLLYKHFSSDEEMVLEYHRGGLDKMVIPYEYMSDFVDNEYLKMTPRDGTSGIAINSFQTVEARDLYALNHPNNNVDTSFVPEPILGYLDMKKALYYGLDRISICENYSVYRLPISTYFTDQSFVHGDTLYVPVYGTPSGIEMKDEFQNDEMMYDYNLAKEYFISAVGKAIDDGYYQAGTVDEYLTIHLELAYNHNDNEAYLAYVNEIASSYTNLLQDDVHYVKVIVDLKPIQYPDSYYSFTKTVSFDLAFYSIIPFCYLNATDVLRSFSDGNISSCDYFNFGGDTSSTVIPVSYVNPEGQVVYERWSYNGLLEALLGHVFIEDGKKMNVWEEPVDLFNAKLYPYQVYTDSYVLNNDLENQMYDQIHVLLFNEGWTALESYIVTDNDGGLWLFVLGKTDDYYELYYQTRVYENVEDAMTSYILDVFHLEPTLIEVSGPLTDQQIATNVYLQHYFEDLTSLDAIAEEHDLNPDNLEIYACTWQISATWEDVFAVSHIGTYYIPMKWL